MTLYIDTHVAAWLAFGELDRLSPVAREALRDAELVISPMVLLELEYLYEIKRTLLTSREIEEKLRREAAVRVCGISFREIVAVAAGEKWTREPFDRLIVANAKAACLSRLVTADRQIRKNYPPAIW